MDNESYQLMALGGIALTGLITSRYLDCKRKEFVDNFCKRAEGYIIRARKITDDLNNRFSNSIGALEKGA